MAAVSKQDPAKSAPTAAATSDKKSKRPSVRKAGPKRRRERQPAKAARAHRTAPAKPTPRPRARRKQSTKAERAKILAAADRNGLTAVQVQKRFGVKPVTYYSWRKAQKKSVTSTRSRAPRRVAAGLDLKGGVREAVRSHIARLLPEIIRSEVERVLVGRGKR